MPGFGTSQYGISQYGIGDGGGISPPIVISSLLVQAADPNIGNPAIINSFGAVLNDTSIDDSFVVLSLAKWSLAATGEYSYVTGLAGLDLNLDTGRFGISLRQTTAAANMSVRFSILSTLDINNAISDIVFAGLKYGSDPLNYVSIERCFSGVRGHYIKASVCQGGRIISNITPTNVASGILHIAAYSTKFSVGVNGVSKLAGTNTSSGGTICIYADVTSSGMPIRTLITDFTSSLGFMFGSSFANGVTSLINDTYVVAIPQSNVNGLVDVFAFNHAGLVGFRANAFEYPLVTGVRMSQMQGFNATIQNDPVLR